jgi:hypothetical protein
VKKRFELIQGNREIPTDPKIWFVDEKVFCVPKMDEGDKDIMISMKIKTMEKIMKDNIDINRIRALFFDEEVFNGYEDYELHTASAVDEHIGKVVIFEFMLTEDDIVIDVLDLLDYKVFQKIIVKER